MTINQALQGLKIADFSWVITGPLATKTLADHGATVVKVESMTNPEVCRTIAPYARGKHSVNTAVSFYQNNSSKYGLTLNLNNARGLELAYRLIAWSDVVIESFMPGVMEKLGLSYESLQKIKKDIIMVRASMQGQTGPNAKIASYGPQLMALAGFSNLAGWPDRGPVGVTAVTDWIAPWYVAIAIMAALEYKHKTGSGQYIDLSQLEASLSFISVPILNFAVNGRIQTRMGNRSPYSAPHGAYPCLGEDRWCVIAVYNNDEWERFCRVVGKPELAKKLPSLPDRKAREDELDNIISEWTRKYTAEEVMKIMQEVGISAGVVQTGKDLHEDPQLKHRHHFKLIEHPEIGLCSHEETSFRLSKTPSQLRPAPNMGQHNYYVATQLLGLSDEKFVDYSKEGAFD